MCVKPKDCRSSHPYANSISSSDSFGSYINQEECNAIVTDDGGIGYIDSGSSMCVADCSPAYGVTTDTISLC